MAQATDAMMDAVVFKAKCTVAVERVAMPRIEEPGDAVVRIELAGLCGSDLHPFHCRELTDVGTVMGHELVGRVVQTGVSVARLAVGDRVMSPFTTCCGACFYCQAALPCRCERGQLLGFLEGGKGLQGAQAQFIRVPMADATLVIVPEDVTDEEALLLGDIFSTGFFCAHNAGIGGPSALHTLLAKAAAVVTARAEGVAGGFAAAGQVCSTTLSGTHGGGSEGVDAEEGAQQGSHQVVAVVGCGPVGLFAVMAARALGAATIFGIDQLPDRLEMAARLGAQPLDRQRQDPVEAIRAATGGRGADVVLEVVGSPLALRLAYELVRPGGIISAVGCHTDTCFHFTPAEAYGKNLTFKAGRCPARWYMEKLLPLVQSKLLDIAIVISHRLPLCEAVRAYEMFDSKQEGCTKVVLRPWA